MKVACFYHCFVGGRWQEPALEHLAALEASGFDGPVFLGVVGPLPDCERALALWNSIGRPATVAATAEVGHEQVTINAVHEYAMQNDGAVLYAHTKGASAHTSFNASWRRAMTLRVVSRWRENVALLDHGADAVGCHWLTPAEYSHWGCLRPFFGGNFWIARCDYLRTLAACPNQDRFDAEAWIGLGNPRVADLFPGWPGQRRWPEQPPLSGTSIRAWDARCLDDQGALPVRSETSQLSPGGQACFETR